MQADADFGLSEKQVQAQILAGQSNAESSVQSKPYGQIIWDNTMTYFNLLNYETVGGTPVLGINAPVLIGHGCSSAEAIKNMVLQTEKTIHAQLDTKLRERFS